jgi:hypothetical protein
MSLDRTPVDQARQAFAQARTARMQAQADLITKNATLAQLHRTKPLSDPQVQAAQAAVSAQQTTVLNTRTAEKAASSAISTTLAGWLLEDPAQDVAQLEAIHPIVLVPLRIETRFSPDGTQLMVRIYPDEISADAHEPDLSASELQAGKDYWTRGDTLTSWQQLLQTYPSQRAAWIVRITDPNLTTKPATFNKPSGWSRSVEARLLPDRFVVIATRTVQGVPTTRRGVSAPVAEPLALSVGPDSLDSDQVQIGPDGKFKIDDAVKWTIDYQTALAAGMAVTLQIAPIDYELGFDRVIVLGVKSSLDPYVTGQQLGTLFDAQHYTAGLAFVKQGAPTSNTIGTPAAYPPADDNGTHSFAIERGAALDSKDNCAGQNLATIIGLPQGTLSHVEGADLQELTTAQGMSRVLYAATFGYFLDQIMDPLVPPKAVNDIAKHFSQWVVPRGLSSAFRVGRVPYGVLPVTSLDLFQDDTNMTAAHQRMVKLLQKIKPLILGNSSQVPHIYRTLGPNGIDQDLLDVLSMDASARQIRVRRVVGEDTYANLLDLFAMPQTLWAAQHRVLGALALNAAGIDVTGQQPRILGMNYRDTDGLYKGSIVEINDVISETAGLQFDYISWIRNADYDQLLLEQIPSGWPADVRQLLLYRFLRHTALTEIHWWASRVIALEYPKVKNPANTVAKPIQIRWNEPELVDIIPGTENQQSPLERVRNVITTAKAGDVALHRFVTGDYEDLPVEVDFKSFTAALDALTGLPSAELQRLFTETLDTTSHRIDAWITSLANERLLAMRNEDDFQPACYIGAYGWVENLKPENATLVTLPNGRTVRTTPGGYVQGPTMAHAMTAAVLRNAYLSRLDTVNPAFAVDLSSAQVRMGRFVLDSVRNGQPVGAVFGYLIERALHDAQAESLIDPIRQVAPLVANKIEDSGEPVDVVAARNVVDGLALRNLWKAGQLFGPGGLSATILHRDILEQQLGQLDRNVDAVADLLLAESVHQVILGSTTASSSGLDALAQGVRLPDPAVGRSTTGGTTLTHRVGIVLDAAPAGLGAGWPATPTPRAACEPRLDAWVAALLGDPRNVKCTVQYPDSSNPPVTQNVTVTFDQLQLRPLDVLALAKSVSTQPAASELDRRVLFAAFGETVPANAAPSASFTIVYAADPSWDRATTRSVPELLDLANAISQFVGGTRSLAPADVVLPETWDKSQGDMTIATAEAQTRAQAAFTALTNVQQALQSAVNAAQAAPIRAAMRDVSLLGVASVFPAFVAGGQEGGVGPLTLMEQAASALTELQSRVTAYNAAGSDVQAQAKAVFGRDFQVIVGFSYAGATGAELAQAVAYGPTMLGSDKHVVDRWLTGVMRVREPLGRWRILRVLAEASGAAPANWSIAQLPHDAKASWVGVPPNTNEVRISGKLSLALNPQSSAIDLTQPSYGLFVDEWVETIPNASEHTGVMFRHEDTAGEAPQTILVCVPPKAGMNWDFDSLLAILNETFDLAKIRATDLQALEPYAQLIPAIFLAASAADTGIATLIATKLDASRAERGAM